MATKKRLILVASLSLAAIAVTVGVLVVLPLRPGVTKANFDRIQEGKRLEEVEQIFGGKGQSPREELRDFKELLCIWITDDGSLGSITFRDDCVLGKRWVARRLLRFDETFLDKIRRWLRVP
jgi:hypothetical protein